MGQEPMSSKVPSDSTSDRIRAIAKQLSELHATHNEALKEAAFGGMTRKEKEMSESDVARIKALTDELLLLTSLR
jgi:hypothetical protein